ncbi:ABC transporter ATP-binding protein [Deltaproteobacteria bacterium TL4]
MISPLKIERLTKTYDQVMALEDCTFDVRPGEIFGLLGPNGAGKTTLISMLTSLTTPTSGSAAIFGHNIMTESLQARKKVGLVPQELVSHGFFTIDDILTFHSGYYGIKNNRKRIDYLLERLALDTHRHKKVTQLSGGMKRRLLIAKALVHWPPLLLLDEPTAGVDVELRNTLWAFVRELNESGMVIVLTTHYLAEAEALCDRIGILNHGKLIALDQTRKIIHDITFRTVELRLSHPWTLVSPQPGIEVNGKRIIAQISYNETVGELVKRLNLPLELVVDITTAEGSLEDAFLSLVNQDRLLVEGAKKVQ